LSAAAWNLVPEGAVVAYVVEAARQAGFVQRVVLFGSRARGDSRPWSDYDFAFTLAQGTPEADWMVFKLDLEEDAPTLCRIAAMRLDPAIRPELLANVTKEGKVVYGR
jgi:predicted nucleotidyltransferase